MQKEKMQKETCLGIAGGFPCRTGVNSPNRHALLCGVTGSGKSVRQEMLELENAKNGATVIVIDLNSSREAGKIFGPIQMEYSALSNRIDSRRDGFNLSFLRSLQSSDGRVEDYVNLVNSAVLALSAGHKMGSRQVAALRKAVIFAIDHLNEFPDEMTAIGAGLLQQDENVAEGVYQRLWTVFNSGIFRPSTKGVRSGMLNIVSFTDMDGLTQRTFVEILLSYLWRTVQYLNCFDGAELVLSIDEFQNLSLAEGSVLRNILREGRKFGLNLLLATQTLSVFPKDTRVILNQAGTKLYFRQAVNEVPSIAREIDAHNKEHWMTVLKSLRVGEAVAVGNFCVGGRAIDYPILTQ